MEDLKRIGYYGVVLTYGKETAVDERDKTSAEENIVDLAAEAELKTWKNGTLETVRLAEKGDMVALRC